MFEQKYKLTENLRYFYTLLLWTWVGTIYANIVNYEFLIKVLMEFSWTTIFSFIAPLLAWLVGVLHENFISVCLATVAIGAFLYSSFLLKVHFRSFKTGVTLSEMNRLKCKLIGKLGPEVLTRIFGGTSFQGWRKFSGLEKIFRVGTKFQG